MAIFEYISVMISVLLGLAITHLAVGIVGVIQERDRVRGLEGFLAIEKHILVRRGVFPSARRRPPCAWELDPETAAEVDRLLQHLATALGESRSADES